MKLTIDTDQKTLIEEQNGIIQEHKLYSKDSFELITHNWLKIGWNEKYPYTFSWMGRPIIQLPEDIIRSQEVICQLQPDVILETGIAHGGSLIFYASLCKAIEKGRVIGVDIEIRPHNRKAIEAHPLFPFITLIEGSSTDIEIVKKVKSLIKAEEKVLIFLDSCHTKEHVLAELEAYHNLVSVGSYIVATDGIMKDLSDVPRGYKNWKDDNPVEAVKEFLLNHPEFVESTPSWPFNESNLTHGITHWPCAYLQRKG